MHSLGPGEPAISEWQKAGLELPDLAEMRRHRLARVRAELIAQDCAAAVLYDPLNVRYAADSTNMQLWISHNAARYCFVAADGPLIMFDYHMCGHLSAHNPLIDEVRPAIGWFYFQSGGRLGEFALKWADEIADLVKQVGGDSRRLAMDRCNPEGASALAKRGVEIINGEEIMEKARAVKCADEIRAMRCAINACEKSIELMREDLSPGITENRLWSRLHAENIARGGEWIETRLLASGPRTNPWFQECASRPIENGDLLAFDTDLIGPYGICVDISRTWLTGDGKPNSEQREIYELAREQIERNIELLKPGISFREFSEIAHAYSPEKYLRYSVLCHGVGLCDEHPSLSFADLWKAKGCDGVFEKGMVVCIESYVGKIGGREGVKLEEQILIAENGAEKLSSYPLGLVD